MCVCVCVCVCLFATVLFVVSWFGEGLRDCGMDLAGAPEKLAIIIEGESLLNDGTAYVSPFAYMHRLRWIQC